MVSEALLLGLLGVAAATDLWRHRIYNRTTYPGILAAVGLNALGTGLLALGTVEEATLRRLGWIGLGDSAAGLAVCGGILLACYLVLKVRGGDVKLMAMLGAFLGLERGLTAMLWTFVLGGCMGLIMLVWRSGPLHLAGAAGRHVLWTLRLGRFQPLSAEEHAALQAPLFLAPSALIACVIVIFRLDVRLWP